MDPVMGLYRMKTLDEEKFDRYLGSPFVRLPNDTVALFVEQILIEECGYEPGNGISENAFNEIRDIWIDEFFDRVYS